MNIFVISLMLSFSIPSYFYSYEVNEYAIQKTIVLELEGNYYEYKIEYPSDRSPSFPFCYLMAIGGEYEDEKDNDYYLEKTKIGDHTYITTNDKLHQIVVLPHDPNCGCGENQVPFLIVPKY